MAEHVDNPAGTDGFAFVEYAAPEPAALARLFERMGFAAVARHWSKDVTLLYRQGGVNFILNAEPASLAQSFARVHGPSAGSPVAVSPGEIGAAGARLDLPLEVDVNGEPLGAPEAGDDMAFDFPALIAHAAKTRPLGAGTIIGSGTVANADASRGFCRILERRAVERPAGRRRRSCASVITCASRCATAPATPFSAPSSSRSGATRAPASAWIS